MSDLAPKSIFKVQPPPRVRRKDYINQKQDKLQADMFGDGEFIFENHTAGDLHLPKPGKGNVKIVPKGKRFIGDSYFFQLVKSHDLTFIEEIKMEPKLVVEQPPTVTTKGTVEFVTETPMRKLNEGTDKEDVLLVEHPVDGISIVQ